MYFCCHDTSLNSGGHIRRSSISLNKLAGFVKSLQCAHKTCLLDVVHSDRPKDTMFRTKILYPQPDIYDKIANLGQCSVIGSCMSGLTGKAAMRMMVKMKKESNDEVRIIYSLVVVSELVLIFGS